MVDFAKDNDYLAQIGEHTKTIKLCAQEGLIAPDARFTHAF